MATDNLSLVLHAAKDMRLEQMPLPGKPGRNEVRLKTHSVGICGSDVHYWQHGAIGDFVLTSPMILGHETAATVVAIGDGVRDLVVGDRVAVEGGIPCRICQYCKEGRYNLCPDMTFPATPPHHGTLTRFFNHPADFCFKLPENMTFEEGALLEPLAVGVAACQRAGVTAGKSVLITGAGPIGLVNILTANAFGAAHVCVTDINPDRLELAKKLGAHKAVLVTKEDTSEALAAKVRHALGEDPSITIECSGAPSSVRLAIYSTRPGGTIVIVGMGAPEISMPLVKAGCKELDIRGVFRYKNCYPVARQLVTSGKVDVKPLVTHRFTLEESVQAFETALAGAGVKVMINCE